MYFENNRWQVYLGSDPVLRPWWPWVKYEHGGNTRKLIVFGWCVACSGPYDDTQGSEQSEQKGS